MGTVISEVGLNGFPAVKAFLHSSLGRKVNLPLPVAKVELETMLEFEQRARFIPAKSIMSRFTDEK